MASINSLNGHAKSQKSSHFSHSFHTPREKENKGEENNSQPAKVSAHFPAIYLWREACKRPIYSRSMHVNFT